MKVSRARSLAAVFAAAVLAFGVAACGGDDSDDGGATSEDGLTQAQLLLPFSESISFYPLIVARDQGYFADEGVEVESIVADSGASVVQQLTAGNVDFGVTNAENILIGASRGSELRAVQELNSGVFTIAAPPNSDVSSVADLQGGTLGLTDASGGEVPLVNAALEENGLTPDEDVALPAVGPGGPAVYQAFESGRIDAYAGAGNDLAGVVGAGIDLEPIIDEKYADLPANYLVATQETLDDESKRETLLAIGRAWNEAVEWTIDNRDQAYEITCEAVPEDCQNEAAAQDYFDRTLATYEPTQGQPIGTPDMEGLDTLLQSFVADDLEGDVSLDTVFPEEYLDELQPDSQ